jgi:mannonate dehydratase
MTRRKWLSLAGAGLLGLVGLRWLVPRVMRSGASRRPGVAAAAFAERCFDGLDRSRVWDVHVHLIGLGAEGSGCRVNPEMLSHLHPIKRFQFDVYKSGAGIDDPATADADYVARLLGLQQAMNPGGKAVLLAFDDYVDERGNARPELSPLYTPNEYALRVADAHPEFLAGASVHPYRTDAVERLDRAVAGGAVAVKWLPNAMGIDPASPLCDTFYRRMAELRLPLLTHGGKEYAVDSGMHQDLGNPLRLRRALDAGVRVVVAHCASMGSYRDLDATGEPQRSSFDLFLRLFTDPRYEKNLHADISTLAHVHHGVQPLRTLLTAPELHSRLFYGSDYPLPALRFLVLPGKLELAGLLDGADRPLCDELFDVNPLLFDFAVNRSLRVVDGGRTYRFAPEVFETARLYRGINRLPSAASNASA